MGQPLYSLAELRAIERRAQVGLPAGALMARAGGTAAAIVRAQLPAADARVLIVCGPGNNGGDGYVCALELARHGVEVVCVALAPPASDDARAAHARWQASGGATLAALPRQSFDAVVDAMFGIGMARPLAAQFLDAAAWTNSRPGTVISLDCPSGLDADTGAWVGGVEGVRASLTVTFIGDKPGLHTADGCDAAGRVLVETIDVDAGESPATLLEPGDFAALLAPRRRNTHKGSFGSVAVIGGGTGMVGAPLLAARAALRLGAGRVYVECIGAPELRFDPMQPELMFRAAATLEGLTACVVGCGLGTDAAARAALEAALARPIPLVIDADALNLIGADDELAQGCAQRRGPTVLTPHPLETARLLRADPTQVNTDRIGHAKRLAARFNALVVLKGAGSVIARPDGRYALNPTGSPALATAGTGDVLAGMIGALIGQCDEPLTAVHAAAWLHGAAADDSGADIGLAAGEIAPLAARHLARLRAAA